MSQRGERFGLPQASFVAVEVRASTPNGSPTFHLELAGVLPSFLPFIISDRPPSFLAFPSKSSLPVKEYEV
jgi:hypothetical protein